MNPHAFHVALNRAIQLHGKLLKAQVQEPSGRTRGLRAPDQRDITQFIFLDIAAQWEDFSVTSFAIELKHTYPAPNRVIERFMTSVDGGRMQGYADPHVILRRAENLLSESSPWRTLGRDLGQQAIDYLDYALTVRNFIAHAGAGRGLTKFHALIEHPGSPIKST